MGKLTINLVPMIGDRGAEVSVCSSTGDEARICGSQKMTAREACAEAARQLREAAARFDLLCNEADPFSLAAQDRVNALDLAAEARPLPVAKAAKKAVKKTAKNVARKGGRK